MMRWQANGKETSMAEIIIYTTPVCPYCARAKQLLKRKGITELQEIDVSGNEQTRDQMIKKSGGKRSVPQNFHQRHAYRWK